MRLTGNVVELKRKLEKKYKEHSDFAMETSTKIVVLLQHAMHKVNGLIFKNKSD